jgi:hypothetical protein
VVNQSKKQGMSRRDFVKTIGVGIGALQTAGVGLGMLQLTGCGSSAAPPQPPAPQIVNWPIAKQVYTTAQHQVLPRRDRSHHPATQPGRRIPLCEVRLQRVEHRWPVAAHRAQGPCTGLHGSAQRRAAAVLLLHVRHSYRRQGISGTADLRWLERALRSRVRPACRRPIRRFCSRPRRCSTPPSRPSMRCISAAVRFRPVARRRLQ